MKIEIERADLIKAYNTGSTENKKMLERLYGEEIFRSNVKVGCEFISALGKRYKVLNAYYNGGGRARDLETDEIMFFSVEDTDYFTFIE